VPSVGPQIAECQKVLEASGLEYKVSSTCQSSKTLPSLYSCSKSPKHNNLFAHLIFSGYGTNLEGPWDKVMKACRFDSWMDQLIPRLSEIVTPRCTRWVVKESRSVNDLLHPCPAHSQTDIRIGTRTDREISSGGNNGKVARVEEILSKEPKA
jgi:hypothetical protein